MMARTALISCLLLVDHADAFVVPAAPGRTSFRHHRTAGRSNGPAAAAVGLRPPYAAAAAAGVEGAAAERLVSSYASTRSTARMGVVGAGVGRAVGRGLAAAAFATGSFLTRRTAVVGAAVAAVGLLGAVAIKVLDTPSRPYDADANTVGNEYDAWTEDGILESYWGEHIHLGYYNEEERKKGAFRKDFIQAKYDFIDEMAKWGGVVAGPETSPKKVLDVGCGVGGTSRYLAKKLGPETSVTGITLSPKQVERATQLAEEQGVPNAKFQVTNALDMTFEDESFDLVWACESGEHMPDKGKYIEEMTRVLKPGGQLVVATWCQRDNSTMSFTPEEEKKLDFLYSEWTHPHFISINDYAKLMEGTGQLEQVETDDWAEQTTPTWRLSVWVGVVNPWPWLRVPRSYYKTVRDAWCIERMHQAFKKGLMQYGMIKSVKKKKAAPPPPPPPPPPSPEGPTAPPTPVIVP
ncbi:unnamed protein product [Ectocarpus sp. 6 AP-2014]